MAVAETETEAAMVDPVQGAESVVVEIAFLHDKSHAVQAVSSTTTHHTHTLIRTHIPIICTIITTTPIWETTTTGTIASAITLHPEPHKTIQGIISAHSTSRPNSSASTSTLN